MFDPESEAAAAARNAESVPKVVLNGTPLGECDDCGKRFRYRGDTDIQNLDPCPGCGSQNWTKWGYRYDGDDIPADEVGPSTTGGDQP